MDFTQIIQTVLSTNGIFAALSVGLIVWQSKTNQDRETRYIDTINNITTNISEKITNVENDVADIKDAITRGER
jgi:hypothetical protein